MRNRCNKTFSQEEKMYRRQFQVTYKAVWCRPWSSFHPWDSCEIWGASFPICRFCCLSHSQLRARNDHRRSIPPIRALPPKHTLRSRMSFPIFDARSPLRRRSSSLGNHRMNLHLFLCPFCRLFLPLCLFLSTATFRKDGRRNEYVVCISSHTTDTFLVQRDLPCRVWASSPCGES